MLSPSVIAKTHTLQEIEATISKLKTSYEDAFDNLKYSLDDIQSKQMVARQTLKDLADQLNQWLKAKCIITGQSTTEFYSGTFTGNHN